VPLRLEEEEEEEEEEEVAAVLLRFVTPRRLNLLTNPCVVSVTCFTIMSFGEDDDGLFSAITEIILDLSLMSLVPRLLGHFPITGLTIRKRPLKNCQCHIPVVRKESLGRRVLSLRRNVPHPPISLSLPQRHPVANNMTSENPSGRL